jgi:hypothetical protein
LKSIKNTSEVKTPKDKYRIGLSAHLDTKGEWEMDLKITESIENKKITYHLTGGSFTKELILNFILEHVEEETKFTYVVNYKTAWVIFGKFLEKLFVNRMVEKGVDKALENLKNILGK